MADFLPAHGGLSRAHLLLVDREAVDLGAQVHRLFDRLGVRRVVETKCVMLRARSFPQVSIPENKGDDYSITVRIYNPADPIDQTPAPRFPPSIPGSHCYWD
jgi:hypothetical protein